jgi:hypothetical protein
MKNLRLAGVHDLLYLYSVHRKSFTKWSNHRILIFHSDLFLKMHVVTIYECDYTRGLDWWIGFTDDLNTPLRTTSNYSANANLHTLQITTAPATLFSACCVFNNHSLATASNSGDSSSSRAHVVSVRRIVRNWTVNSTIAPSLLSLPCRAQLNCQASMTHSLTNHFTSLNWTALSRPGVLAL